MKHLLYVVLFIMAIGCGNSTETKNEDPIEVTDNKKNIYAFKTIGLNDSIVSDSIWKMIFTIEGIDQLTIQKDDSLVVVTTSDSLITKTKIKNEITQRGGIIIE